MANRRLYCCVCGRQAISGPPPPRGDSYTTTLVNARAGVKQGEVFCGYCAEDMDENGLFPEERAIVESVER